MQTTGEVCHLADRPSVPERQSPGYTDTGAAALAILAALHQRAIDIARIVHDNGRPGQPLSPDELVLAARRNHFRAKLVRSSARALACLPLPAIGLDRARSFFIIARHEPGRSLVQRPGEPPTVWDADALARE